MNWLIASDLHGSAYYCERLLERFAAEGADRIILLGDVLYHGPRNDLPRDYNPKRVCALLNEYRDRILCVRGNCEAEVDQVVLDFPCLAEYALLPVPGREQNIIFITHGHVFNEKHLPPLCSGDILLNGHFHVPRNTEYADYTYMNPGSLSLPKNGSPHSYMTLKDGEFLWKDIDGSTFRAEEYFY